MPRHRLHPGLWMPRRPDGHRSAGDLRQPVLGHAFLRTSLDRAAHAERLSFCSTEFSGTVSHKYDELGISVLPGTRRRSGAGCRDGSTSGAYGPVYLEFMETPAAYQRISKKT